MYISARFVRYQSTGARIRFKLGMRVVGSPLSMSSSCGTSTLRIVGLADEAELVSLATR